MCQICRGRRQEGARAAPLISFLLRRIEAAEEAEVSSSIDMASSVFLTRSFSSSTSFSRPLITLTLSGRTSDHLTFIPPFFLSLSLSLSLSLPLSLPRPLSPSLSFAAKSIRSPIASCYVFLTSDRALRSDGPTESVPPRPCLPARQREQSSHSAGAVFSGCRMDSRDD